jgi:glycosyltransferase involved in cell wall biosynthesis
MRTKEKNTSRAIPNQFLFIGSFLSDSRGTKDVAETISELLKEDGININLVSRHENKLFRIINIIFSILSYSGAKIHIDVFSGNAFNIALIASFFSKLKKKQIILTLHGGKLPEYAQHNKNKFHSLFHRANYIQTPSLFLKDYFEAQGYTIHYLPNPIKLEKFPYNRRTLNKYSLLWVRAFTSIYNPTLPIIILSYLKQLYSDCTLTMIGPDRGLLESCKILANELGLSNDVFFIGSIPNNELYNYYQTHAVYLNTTSYESFGVAVVEAASCGIPIISNKVGEIPYLWEDKVNILMVENNNINEFIDCVSALFENDELAKKISLNARNKAVAYDWKNIKSNWINIINNV